MHTTSNSITGHYADVDQIKIYFETIGEGKTLLCLHTAGRDCRQWHPLMEYFGTKYRVIAFDMPGHGKSWPLKEKLCIDDPLEYVEFIYKLIHVLGLEELVFVGCSLGGNMSLMLAERYPEKIRAIIPMEGADFTPTISPGSLRLIRSPLVNLHSYNMDFTSSLIGRECSAEASDFIQWSVWQLNPHAQYGDLRTYSLFDIRDRMHNIKCPVLLIRGEDDWIVSQQMVEATRERLTEAAVVELAVLAGVGHFPHVEQPQRVCDRIEQFLDQYSEIVWS